MQELCARSLGRISFRIPSTSVLFKICMTILYKISGKTIFAGPTPDLKLLKIFAEGFVQNLCARGGVGSLAWTLDAV